VSARRCTSIARASAFAHATYRYWLSIFPCARAEQSAWRQRAEQIPDRTLRAAALESLITKSDVLEGAVAFVVLAPPPMHRQVVRAITAFEIAFDYLDTIVELPNPNPVANAHSLGRALLAAFEPGGEHPNYYENYSGGDDAGYLKTLVNACRAAVERLPSFGVIAEPARHSLSRIVSYQSLNHGGTSYSHDAFAEWAQSQTVPGTGLHWWETGAAVGSQLFVLALIAAAGNPTMRAEQVVAIEQAYFPWIGALSTLLDSVVDQHADRSEDQRSLVDYYSSPQVAAERLQLMAFEAQRAVLPLSDAPNHSMILAAMAAFFHSAPQALAPEVGLATQAVLDAMGAWATPALLFFKTRRALARKSQPYIPQITPPLSGTGA
jgi:tetraprenyl-beta-curcumene synthase